MSAADAPLVGILVGSESDRERMQAAMDDLTERGIAHEFEVRSAHRNPDAVAEYALESSSNRMTDGLPVGPGKVRRARHGAKISLALRRMNGSACQLPVGNMEIVPAHSLVQLRHIISANLMA